MPISIDNVNKLSEPNEYEVRFSCTACNKSFAEHRSTHVLEIVLKAINDSTCGTGHHITTLLRKSDKADRSVKQYQAYISAIEHLGLSHKNIGKALQEVKPLIKGTRTDAEVEEALDNHPITGPLRKAIREEEEKLGLHNNDSNAQKTQKDC